MHIPDIHDFNPVRAAKELLTLGFTAFDDVSGQLVDCALEELHDALGFAADDLDIRVDEIDTSWGPIFVFRDRSRATLKTVRAAVFAQRPDLRKKPIQTGE